MHKKIVGATLALAFGLGGAVAQNYPDRPVRIVVPFAAGGASDIVARLAAEDLSRSLGQQFIVENKPGAAGNIGARQVARASPDGYTLLHTSSAIMLNEFIYKDSGYTLGQFTPVMQTGSNCSVVAVHPSAGVTTLKDLVSKAADERLTYATAGVGSTPHISGEVLLRAIAKANFVHVPYTGGSPALTAVLGNQVPVAVLTLATGNVIELINTGKLKGLAITCPERHPTLPDVPTVLETEYMSYGTDSTWGGFFVPAGTPDEIVERLNKALGAAFQNNPVKERLANLGLSWKPHSVKDFGEQVRREAKIWQDRVKTIGLEPQ